MKAVILLVALAVVSATLPALPEPAYESLFTAFVSQFGKTYHADEFFTKYHVFRTNLDKIRNHNAGNSTFTMTMNRFGDMTGEEFQATFTGYNARPRTAVRATRALPVHVSEPAAALDWSTKGAVTPIKDQGQCGSCWAFSTTGSVEGANFIKKGTLVSLSEQNLMDCSGSFGNDGCNGGLMDQAFEYIEKNGIATEASYPYKAVDERCKAFTKSGSTVSSYVDVPANDETSLLSAANIGPVSVAIEADQDVFQFYSSGVITSGCGTDLDHGVLVVGYGTESGTDYWKVKNSWGASWGMNGYVLLERNKNVCGISLSASYPIV